MEMDEVRQMAEGRAKPSNDAQDHRRGLLPLQDYNRNAGSSSTKQSTSNSHEPGRYESEISAPAPLRLYAEPPPLAPYVSDEKRVHPPRISAWGAVPDPGLARYKANPSPNRPPPIHNPPKGSNWRRQIELGQDHPHLRSPSYPQHATAHAHASHHPHPYHSSADSSSRASSSRIQLPSFSTLPGASTMHRSQSSRSHQSIPMSRNQSQNGSSNSLRSSGTSSMMDDNDEQGGGWASAAAPMFDSRRRTRALMTKSQMSELKRLWRKTKFPGNEEREALGHRIGLTPRQVQVWFQNQRQKIRKEINESKIPAGANPQDYVDLDKSPRSRKMQLEASVTNDRPAANSASSSDMSGSSLRLQVSGLGLQTPRDDDSRSIATGSSSGHYNTKTPDNNSPYTTVPGPSGFWDQSRNSSLHPSPVDQHQPFAFHKPPTPVFQARPAPYAGTKHDSSSHLYTNVHLDTRHSYTNQPSASVPPPPMRHAATVDGVPLSRRRSNSLEGMRSSMQDERDANSRSAQSNPRPRTQTTSSELPPSLAALVLPGPVNHDQPIGKLPRFASDHGVPTLPPPRGWTPDSQIRSQTDPTREGSSSSRLPGYESMFGRGQNSDRRHQ